MKLDVTYVDGEPTEVEFFSMVYGLVKFSVEDGVAEVDERWNEVDPKNLMDGFEAKIDTEDVVEAVRALPFIEEVRLREEINDE